MLRDFSDEAKQKLLQYVKDVKNRRIYEQKGGTWLYEQS